MIILRGSFLNSLLDATSRNEYWKKEKSIEELKMRKNWKKEGIMGM